jgi:site-specific recombinase XerD
LRQVFTAPPMPSANSLNKELAARFQRWLLVQRYSPITRQQYGRTVLLFASFLKGPVLETTHLDVQEFLSERAALGKSSRTLRNELYSLRVFFDFLSLGGLIHWTPPRIVQTRPLTPYIPTVLTVENVDRIFAATRNAQERALVELLYGTGCRTCEVRTMRVEDIDFKERRIRVRGKTGERVVMFVSSLAAALRRHLRGRRSGFVFIESKPLQRLIPVPTAPGGWRCRWKKYDELGHRVGIGNGFIRASKRMSYQQALSRFRTLARKDRVQRPLGVRPLCSSVIQKTVARIGLRVGIRVTPYAFRHTYATHLLDNGADIRFIQELLGHSSIRSTQVYAHVSKKKVQQVLERCHPRGRA